MSRADETLIRDEDLRRKLEAARGKFMFDVQVGILVDTQAKRDAERAVKEARQGELDLMTPVQRRQTIIREVIETEPVTPDGLQFTHSVLALCGLPYRRLPEGELEYERKNGRMAVVVQAGKLYAPDGKRVQQPVPFGPKARLLMAHLSTEAIRQDSPTVEIAETLTGFMRDMGIESRGGVRGTIQPFKDQVNALAACRIEMAAWDGHRAKMVDAKPFTKLEVWFPSDPDQKTMWPKTITFSDEFFRSLKKRAMPVNTLVLRHLANSARKLDLYFWLNYKLNSITTVISVPWAALANQFGDGFTRERDFRAQLAEELADLRELFPKLPLKVNEQGISLAPAEPTVLGISPPRPAAKRR